MNYSRGKILNRHRHVEPQLDLIRIGVVASLKTAGVASAHQGIRWPWMALWEEILWPCRRMLQAAASMWLLTAGINFIALNPSTTQPIQAAMRPQDSSPTRSASMVTWQVSFSRPR